MFNHEIISILFKHNKTFISKYFIIIAFLIVIKTPIFYSDNSIINNLVAIDKKHYRAGNFAINSKGDILMTLIIMKLQ